MNERSRNLAVGLTVFIGLVGLLVMMLLFGYVPGWLERSYPVQVHLPDADGLAQGSPVRLHGISIGTVDSVRLAEPPRPGVIAAIRVRRDIRLPESVRASVERPLFGGSTNLNLEVPDTVDADVAYLPTDGSARVVGERAGFVHEVTDEVRAMLDRPISDLERVADQIEAVGREWTTVGRNVNDLIEPRDLEAVDHGESAANLNSLVQRTDARLGELETVLDGLRAYTEDEALREDIRQAAANVRQVSEQLPGQVERISVNVNESIGALRGRYVALADDLSAAVSSMQRLLERAEEGEGTIGRLVNDPSLYENLNDAVVRMQRALDDVRLLIQKWEAEGLPVQF